MRPRPVREFRELAALERERNGRLRAVHRDGRLLQLTPHLRIRLPCADLDRHAATARNAVQVEGDARDAQAVQT